MALARSSAGRLMMRSKPFIGSGTSLAATSESSVLALPACTLLKYWGRGKTQSRHLTVAVAMSGGVDSAVAAAMLKAQGHKVFGIFMRNWDEADERGATSCSHDADLADARRVCQHLRIGLETADFTAAYWTDVFAGFLDKCRRGLTPNPDLACNRHIKFDALLKTARALGADKVATGHYARLQTAPDGSVQLLRGTDRRKDQSYFLASVRPAAFVDVIFPLGGLTKAEVRARAAAAGLHNAHRRSSAGICFVGRRKFGDFIASFAEPLPARYVDAASGEDLGRCANMAAITYGQRASIGGTPERLFAVGKDVPGRRVFVGPGSAHPALYCTEVLLGMPVWLPGAAERLACGDTIECTYKARYQQEPRVCTVAGAQGCSVTSSAFTRLMPEDYPGALEATLQVRMEEPANAITPQQEFVMYSGDICLGSAPILYPGKTLAELQHSVADSAALPAS